MNEETSKTDGDRKLTLSILLVIKEAQQQHGLRHGDYQRYRSYCSRRLRRIRKSLKFIQSSRHRFQKKQITEDMLTDARYLLIPVMTAERSWSYAMQLKQEANTEPRKRFHLISRLRKAAVTAEALDKLCGSDKCDARTKLEAHAYSLWMQGSLLFELRAWEDAKVYFERAEEIYKRLANTLGRDETPIYNQRCDEIAPNIRYCAYNIGDESALTELKKMRSQAAAGEDLLAEKLDSLIAQTRERQAATLSEVQWLGQVIPVQQEKVRVFLLMVDESANEMMKTTDPQAKISILESLLLECKDAIQVVRDEMQSDTSHRARGDGLLSNYELLHSYLSFIRLSKTTERTFLMGEMLRQKLNDKSRETTPSNVPAARDGKRVVKPQDLIRLYDTIIQNLNEILLLPGVASDVELQKSISKKITACKAFRCYYIAQAFASVKKWVEAISVYDRAYRYAKDASSSDTLDKNLLLQLEELTHNIDAQRYSSHALSILDAEDASESMASLQIREQKPLAERLDVYYEDPSLVSKSPNIVNFPPDYQPVPCKPLFFDLALNHVMLPNLDSYIEPKRPHGSPAAPTGIAGMVKGWLWGGKK